MSLISMQQNTIRSFALARRAGALAAMVLLWLLLLTGLAAPVQAQDVTSGSIDVMPLTAVANTTRRIGLQGVWPNGCPPTPNRWLPCKSAAPPPSAKSKSRRKIADACSPSISLDSRYDLAWEAVLQTGLAAL